MPAPSPHFSGCQPQPAWPVMDWQPSPFACSSVSAATVSSSGFDKFMPRCWGLCAGPRHLRPSTFSKCYQYYWILQTWLPSYRCKSRELGPCYRGGCLPTVVSSRRKIQVGWFNSGRRIRLPSGSQLAMCPPSNFPSSKCLRNPKQSHQNYKHSRLIWTQLGQSILSPNCQFRWTRSTNAYSP